MTQLNAFHLSVPGSSMALKIRKLGLHATVDDAAPRVGGVKLDLCRLFTLVEVRGGYEAGASTCPLFSST